MHVDFGEDLLRAFDVARGRILAFSIDLLRRLYKARTAAVRVSNFAHGFRGHGLVGLCLNLS